MFLRDKNFSVLGLQIYPFPLFLLPIDVLQLKKKKKKLGSSDVLSFEGLSVNPLMHTPELNVEYVY